MNNTIIKRKGSLSENDIDEKISSNGKPTTNGISDTINDIGNDFDKKNIGKKLIEEKHKEEIQFNVNEVFETSIQIKKLAKEKIEFTEPDVYFQSDENDSNSKLPFLYSNTICLIQGGAGSHKSHLSESIISSLLSGNVVAGFKSNDNREYVIPHLDTERAIKDAFPYAVSNVLKRAGIYDDDEFPSNYIPISFIPINREIRLQVLKEILDKIFNDDDNKGKKVILVIDLASDMMTNFNDVKETMLFIDYMNNLINSYNCSIIVVLHENPGTAIEKTRGHLGTELTNKARSIIKVGIENDYIYMKFLKLSYNKRPVEKFLFAYSEEEKGLILLQPNELIDNQKVIDDEKVNKLFTAIKQSQLTKHTESDDYESYELQLKLYINSYQKIFGGSDSKIRKLLKDYSNYELDGYNIKTETLNKKQGTMVILTNKLENDDVLQTEMYGIENEN